MTSFLSGSSPPELVWRILVLCNTLGDVKALICTCRHIYSAWALDAPRILAAIGSRNIVRFDMALMVVRATEIVHEAEQAARLPPVIDPQTLTITARGPSPAEFRLVQELDHLIRCLQVKYYHHLPDRHYREYCTPHGRWPSDRNPPPPVGLPEEPEGMSKWDKRFRTAMYLALLLGPLMASAYQQPFMPDDNRPLFDDRVRHAAVYKTLLKHRRWRDYDRVWFTEQENEYFRRFAIFDSVGAVEERDRVFGPLSEWLVQFLLEDVRSRAVAKEYPSRSLPGPTPHLIPRRRRDATWMGGGAPPAPRVDWLGSFSQGSRAECEGVVWGLMQSVHAFEFILDCVRNRGGTARLGRPATEVPALKGTERLVKVVLFGSFTCEELSLPDDPSDAANVFLQARQVAPPSSKAVESMGGVDIPLALDCVYCHGGGPNSVTGYPAPPPPLQLFTYTLKEHFNLQFAQDAFQMYRDWHQLYRDFRARASILANDLEYVPVDWLAPHLENSYERDRMDVSDGTEILTKYEPTTARFLSLDCNPRRYDGFIDVYAR